MTAPHREPGMDEDQGQARTRGAWMLKPNAFDAMTAILDVPTQRRRKPSGYDGLTGDCRIPIPARWQIKQKRNSMTMNHKCWKSCSPRPA